MSKNVSLCLILALTSLTIVNALVLHRKMNENHLEELQNHKAYHIVHQRLTKLMHLDAESDQDIDMNGPIGDFFMWMMSDKDVVDSATNQKPLPDETAAKIRKYLTDHPEIIDSFMTQTQDDDDKTAECLNKMNKQQKQKFYGWILEDMDFKNMFVGGQESLEMGEEEKNKLTEKALNDPELGPVFKSCGGTTKPSRY